MRNLIWAALAVLALAFVVDDASACGRRRFGSYVGVGYGFGGPAYSVGYGGYGWGYPAYRSYYGGYRGYYGGYRGYHGGYRGYYGGYGGVGVSVVVPFGRGWR